MKEFQNESAEDSALWAFVMLCLVVVFVIGVFKLCDSRSYRNLPAWSIVKQRTNEHYQLDNYGYVTDIGSVIAGFDRKEDAIRERDMARNPPKPKPEKPKSMWEIVK